MKRAPRAESDITLFSNSLVSTSDAAGDVASYCYIPIYHRQLLVGRNNSLVLMVKSLNSHCLRLN